MSLNLETLNPKELADLISRANKRKKLLSKRKPAAQTKAAVAKVLKSAGWTFEELFGKSGGATATTATRKTRGSTKGRKLGKVEPKYRNPANPKEEWSGRGRSPRWLADYVAAGRNADEFLIK